ncbi:MAG: hypothetical protein H7Z75_22245 [Ferruginibacter sp.]|nr:hypothetical protein [Cytophagales bacterium]
MADKNDITELVAELLLRADRTDARVLQIVNILNENSSTVGFILTEMKEMKDLQRSTLEVQQAHTEAILGLQQGLRNVIEVQQVHTQAILGLQEGQRSIIDVQQAHTQAILGLQEGQREQTQAIVGLQEGQQRLLEEMRWVRKDINQVIGVKIEERLNQLEAKVYGKNG